MVEQSLEKITESLFQLYLFSPDSKRLKKKKKQESTGKGNGNKYLSITHVVQK